MKQREYEYARNRVGRPETGRKRDCKTQYMGDTGKILMSYRIKAGYTQKEVAEELGLSDRTISNFENGYSGNVPVMIFYLFTFVPPTETNKVIEDIWGNIVDWNAKNKEMGV